MLHDFGVVNAFASLHVGQSWVFSACALHVFDVCSVNYCHHVHQSSWTAGPHKLFVDPQNNLVLFMRLICKTDLGFQQNITFMAK